MTIQCSITSGDLPVTFLWLLNNNLLNETNGIRIFQLGNKVSSLVIEDLNENHVGNYSCKVENEAGATKHTAKLVINGIRHIFFSINYSFLSFQTKIGGYLYVINVYMPL